MPGEREAACWWKGAARVDVGEDAAPAAIPRLHHWQCDYNFEGYSRDCNCGVSGPRHPLMDRLPAGRPPTREESEEAHRGG